MTRQGGEVRRHALIEEAIRAFGREGYVSMNLVTGMRYYAWEPASAADLPPGWPPVLRAVHRHCLACGTRP